MARKISSANAESVPRRGGRRKKPTQLLECEGCDIAKDADEFQRYLRAVVDLSDEMPPLQLCDACAVYGPPSENPLVALTQPEIAALEILSTGGSLRKAASIMGTSVARLVQRLEGRSNDRKVFRQAYKTLLIQAGVTPRKLTSAISDALQAEKISFGKDGQEYSQPDHGARLKAVSIAQRALELEDHGARTEGTTAQQNNFYFETNLGNGEKTVDDAYEVFAERIGS